MLEKTQVLETINQLDNNFTIDELFERISFIEKVEEGLSDSENGRKISQEELQNEIKEWFR